MATGELGDPRSFKRPVRVTVPRALPTDDVLVARKAERGESLAGTSRRPELARARTLADGADGAERRSVFPAWKTAQTLALVERAALAQPHASGQAVTNGHAGMAVVCASLDEVRDLALRAPDIADSVRAVLAAYIPGSLVALLSAVGIAALRVDASAVRALRGQATIVLPPPSHWPERQATTVVAGSAKVPVTWLALGDERAWATGAAKSAGPGQLARGPASASAGKAAATRS